MQELNTFYVKESIARLQRKASKSPSIVKKVIIRVKTEDNMKKASNKEGVYIIWLTSLHKDETILLSTRLLCPGIVQPSQDLIVLEEFNDFVVPDSNMDETEDVEDDGNDNLISIKKKKSVFKCDIQKKIYKYAQQTNIVSRAIITMNDKGTLQVLNTLDLHP